MKQDERGLPLSTDSEEAVRLFDRAVEHYLKYHIDTMSLVAGSIAADPRFVMAQCLKGYMLLSAANQANNQQIAATLEVAKAGVGTRRELQHVAAFEAWAARRTRQVLRHLAGDPGRDADRSAGLAHL
jgi:hypothetical protein